ncbi:MAG: glucosyltransferase domain-containing protein [Clostridia bacterium]|nr:glucosyltransferase domain-containing protein [Clostridia bacterium]
MPETLFQSIKQKISPAQKTCFITAIVVGLLAHFYKITNWIPNWDSLVFRYDSQNMTALGRWFLPVVCSFSSFFDLPFVNGMLAILFHSLGAVVICKMFDIRKNITAGLIGSCVVSFPTVVSVMMYTYVADGYSIAFFLSCLSAYYMTKEKPNWILGIVCITLSAGIYQAYLTVTILLLLLHLTDGLVFGNKEVFKTVKSGLGMLICGVSGMVLYYGILTGILTLTHTKLLEYQGMNSAGSLAGLDILGSLYTIKETFVTYFFDFSDGISLFCVWNVLIFALMAVFYLRYIIKNKIYTSPGKLLLLICLGVFLILGGGILAFLNATIDYHNLMLMGYVVFYLFFLLLYERGEETKPVFWVGKCWMVLLTALVLIANQTVLANVSYHKAQMAYETSYGTLIRLSDRIEQTPDAEGCSRILVVGALDNSQDYSVNFPPDMTGITDGYILRADDETVGQSVLCSAINDYCGKNYVFLSGEEKQAFLQKQEVTSMNSWPHRDSVRVVEDIIVVKLSEEAQK